MSDVPYQTVFETVRKQTPDDETATGLIAEALHALNLPARENYHPSEVVAIGTYLMGISTQELKRLREDLPPETRAMAERLDPLTTTLKEALVELEKESQ